MGSIPGRGTKILHTTWYSQGGRGDESACPQAILVGREDQYKACGMSEGEKHVGTFVGGSSLCLFGFF